jgi:hypothetical protein
VVVLGEVVGKVVRAFSPMYVKLSLSDTVANPVEAHAEGLGSLVLDGIVSDAFRALVVGLDRRDELRMAELGERGADHAAVLGVEEQGGKLGVRGGGDDVMLFT